MLFLALTRCKYQVTGRIGCSRRGAGEFTWGNPWDLLCKLRAAPAAKDEAGFPSVPTGCRCVPGGFRFALMLGRTGPRICCGSAQHLRGLTQHHLLGLWCHLQQVVMGVTSLLSHHASCRIPRNDQHCTKLLMLNILKEMGKKKINELCSVCGKLGSLHLLLPAAHCINLSTCFEVSAVVRGVFSFLFSV